MEILEKESQIFITECWKWDVLPDIHDDAYAMNYIMPPPRRNFQRYAEMDEKPYGRTADSEWHILKKREFLRTFDSELGKPRSH